MYCRIILLLAFLTVLTFGAEPKPGPTELQVRSCFRITQLTKISPNQILKKTVKKLSKALKKQGKEQKVLGEEQKVQGEELKVQGEELQQILNTTAGKNFSVHKSFEIGSN